MVGEDIGKSKLGSCHVGFLKVDHIMRITPSHKTTLFCLLLKILQINLILKLRLIERIFYHVLLLPSITGGR